MSEYQYYEFLAVDRTLTPQQIEQLRRFSSRAEISATRFVNEYNWGGFRGDAEKFLTDYFDLHVYTANWGTHTFALGVPAEALDITAAKKYATNDTTQIKKKSDRILLTFTFTSEDGGEYDDSSGEEWMSQLAPIREEILAGDLRPLYLAWLAGIWQDPQADVPEPPIPAGLENLTPAQIALAEFLYLDPHLLAIAAEESPRREKTAPDITRWLSTIPATQKDQWLRDLLDGQASTVIRQLRNRLRKDNPTPVQAATSTRTASQLLAAAKFRAEQAERRAAERKACQQAKRDAEAAAAREKYLRSLAPKVSQLWQQADHLITTKLPKNYDQAATLLTDLRDLARLTDEIEDFQRRFLDLRDRHQSKPALQQRLHKIQP